MQAPELVYKIQDRTVDVPPCTLSTCSTNNTGSTKPLPHLGQASIVTPYWPGGMPRLWFLSECSIKAETDENFAGHWGHCSTRALLLFCDIPSFAFCNAWAVTSLNLWMLDSAEARTLDAALTKPEPHHDEPFELWLRTGAFELLLVTGSLFWLFLNKLIKGKLVSGFLGPGHLWSGPNLCFKQCSWVQSLQRIVFEKVSISLQPGTGHFLFLVAFW